MPRTNYFYSGSSQPCKRKVQCAYSGCDFNGERRGLPNHMDAMHTGLPICLKTSGHEFQKCIQCGTVAQSCLPHGEDQFFCGPCFWKPAVVIRSHPPGTTCANCGVMDAARWRRNKKGEPVCNACRLHFDIHGVPRPVAFERHRAQTRKRKTRTKKTSEKQKRKGETDWRCADCGIRMARRRRRTDGELRCNACVQYFTKRGIRRPVDLAITKMAKRRNLEADGVDQHENEDERVQDDAASEMASGVRRHSEEVASGVRRHSGEMASGVRRHSEEMASRVRRHSEGMASGVRRHSGEMASGVRRNSGEMASGVRRHSEEMASGVRRHSGEMASRVRRHSEEMASGVRRHSGEMASGVRRYREEMASGVRRHSEEMASRVRRHSGEMASGVRRHSGEMASGVRRHSGEMASGVRRHSGEMASGVRQHSGEMASGVRRHSGEMTKSVGQQDTSLPYKAATFPACLMPAVVISSADQMAALRLSRRQKTGTEQAQEDGAAGGALADEQAAGTAPFDCSSPSRSEPAELRRVSAKPRPSRSRKTSKENRPPKLSGAPTACGEDISATASSRKRSNAQVTKKPGAPKKRKKGEENDTGAELESRKSPEKTASSPPTEPDVWEDADSSTTSSATCRSDDGSSCGERLPPDPVPPMSAVHARQLDHQMAAHVQLLAQTHLLCSEHGWLHAERDGCAALLAELNSLSSAVHVDDPSRSFFSPPNLAPALEMVAEIEKKSQEELSENPSKLVVRAPRINSAKERLCRLSDRIVDTVLGSTAFVFPQLLPMGCALRPEDLSGSSSWLPPAVDQLIAMGIDMFSTYACPPGESQRNVRLACKLMSKYMLPLTQVKIIRRIWHMQRYSAPDNPIALYLERNVLPLLPTIDILPECPLKPMRSRLEELCDPWYSLVLGGNAFFHTNGGERLGKLVSDDEIMNAVHSTPPELPEQRGSRQEPGPEQLQAPERISVCGCEKAMPCRTGGCCRQEVAPAATVCVPTTVHTAPLSSRTHTAVPYPAQIPDITESDPDDPDLADSIPESVGGTEGQPQCVIRSSGDSEGYQSDTEAPESEPVADLGAVKSLPTAQKTVITDAYSGEELVSLITEEETAAPASPGGTPSAAIVPTSSGPAPATQADGSVIELKEEDGSLVVYIRGPGRPTMRVPVRSARSTRLLLPPSLVLQEAGSGRPAPGAAKRTGVVTPTVRQRSMSPPSLPAPEADESPPPGSTESPPLSPAESAVSPPPDRADSVGTAQSPPAQREDKQTRAQGFFQRVKDCTESVDPAIYEQFEKLLTDFAESPDDEAALYDAVCRLLKGFPDLADEFLMFVSSDVAVRRGVVTEHVRGTRLQELARGIAAVNSAHPTQVLRPARVISCSEPEEPVGAASGPAPGDGSPPTKRARRRTGPRAERGRRPRPLPVPAAATSPAPPPPPAEEPEPPPPPAEELEPPPLPVEEPEPLPLPVEELEPPPPPAEEPELPPPPAEELEPPPPPAEELEPPPPPAEEPEPPPPPAEEPEPPPPPAEDLEPPPPPAEELEPPPPPAEELEPPPPPAEEPAEPVEQEPGSEPHLDPKPEQEPEPEPEPEPAPWSREDDLEILTSCQQSGDGEGTFLAIQRRLPSRTVAQLQGRFQRLMEMLREQLQQEPDEFMEEDL